MTIIDTTLYANGALRLSRHGAGRGGNVLILDAGDWTGQHTIPADRFNDAMDALDKLTEAGLEPEEIFEHIANKYT